MQVALSGRRLAVCGFRLANRCDQSTQHVPQAVQLIDEIEDDGNALFVDAERTQVPDELRPGEIDFGKAVRFAILPWQQPPGLDPGVKRSFVEPRCCKKLL